VTRSRSTRHERSAAGRSTKSVRPRRATPANTKVWWSKMGAPWRFALARPGTASTTYRYLGLVARRLLPADLRLILRATLLLPPRVAWFYARAHVLARRRGDAYSLIAPTRPEDLSPLLRLAKGRRYVVELGTATAWTAIALALADRDREVVSYDPRPHPLRVWYLNRAGARAIARIHLRSLPGQSGPADGDPPAELLFIDIGGHTREDTVVAFLAWRDSLAPGAVVAFHDYGPHSPGVAEAVAQLGLRGHVAGQSLFVWSAQPASE
jgi:predicted O-methyltransferase YrrM